MNKNNPCPKISVIIPVYNSEKYLRKTLESLLNQTMKSFEVIMVNDGSSDSSLDIMNEYREKYIMSRIINIKNSGASAARNIGIEYAQGEYLSFIDSDDFISPIFLERLYDIISKNNADIACCNYYSYYPEKNISIPDIFSMPSGIYKSERIFNSLIKDVRIHYFLWNKLWKRSLFIKSGLRLPNMCFEDIVTVVRLFYISDKIAVDSTPLYYYTKHSDSMVNSMTIQKLNDYIAAFGSIRNFLEINSNYKRYSLSYTLFGCRILFSSVKLILDICIKNNTLDQMPKILKTTFESILYFMGNKFHPIDDCNYILSIFNDNEFYLESAGT